MVVAPKKLGNTYFHATANKKKRAFYFAYGSNLNLAQMRHRCPKANPKQGGGVCIPVKLIDWRLCFRGVADIEPRDGAVVYGGLFEITPACERALDVYEGYPRLYTKALAKVVLPDGTVEEVMFYRMNSRTYESVPGKSYFETICKGYADFQLPDDAFKLLEQAVVDAEEFETRHLRGNPNFRRDHRGRYTEITDIRPFIAARELQGRYADRNHGKRFEPGTMPTLKQWEEFNEDVLRDIGINQGEFSFAMPDTAPIDADQKLCDDCGEPVDECGFCDSWWCLNYGGEDDEIEDDEDDE